MCIFHPRNLHLFSSDFVCFFFLLNFHVCAATNWPAIMLNVAAGYLFRLSLSTKTISSAANRRLRFWAFSMLETMLTNEKWDIRQPKKHFAQERLISLIAWKHGLFRNLFRQHNIFEETKCSINIDAARCGEQQNNWICWKWSKIFCWLFFYLEWHCLCLRSHCVVFSFNWHRTHISFCWFCRIFPFSFRSCLIHFVLHFMYSVIRVCDRLYQNYFYRVSERIAFCYF